MFLESTILDAALSQGIWAILGISLLIYFVKTNEKRDERQAEKKESYQSLITEFAIKLEAFDCIAKDLVDIKNHKILIFMAIEITRKHLFLFREKQCRKK